MRGSRRAVPLVATALLCALALLVAGCRRTPPPPLVGSSPSPSSSPAPEPPSDSAVVAVDHVAGGYNPHRLADSSTITTALARLMLPSVFRVGPHGHENLDRTVMRSAEVTGTDPFTVTYRIRPDAAWSDGVPIRAEDFTYLRQEMVTQTGVADPAGYRSIEGISSRAGGTVVVVTFDEPYPGWRTLFSNLLPAHLLKDAPGGWAGALATGYPASGGPFQVQAFAVARGEIKLQRNDRYWARPSRLRRITFLATSPGGASVPGTAAGLLRTGGAQLAVLRATRTTRAAMAALHGDRVRSRTVPRPEVAQLTLRSPDELVRKAIAAGIDRKALTAAGTQGAKHPHRADSLVAVPALSDELGMPPDAPGARPHPGRAPELLRADGYRRTPTGGWAKDGNPLHVIVGAVGEEPYGAVATELVAELNAAGLPARLRTSRATPLYGSSAAAQAVDVLVGPRPVGGDTASDLASELGCPSATSSGQTSSEIPNAARFCDPELQPLIERALAGQIPVQQALDTLAPQVWSQAVIVPLFQPTDVLAVGDTIRGVAGQEGPTAVFAGVRNWSRTGK